MKILTIWILLNLRVFFLIKMPIFMNTHSVLLRMSSPGDPGGRTPTHKMGDATKILFLDTSSYLYLFNAALRAGIMKRVWAHGLLTLY